MMFESKVVGMDQAVRGLKQDLREWQQSGLSKAQAAAQRLRDDVAEIATRHVLAGMACEPPVEFQYPVGDVEANITVGRLLERPTATFEVKIAPALARVLRFYEYGSSRYGFNPIPMWRTARPEMDRVLDAVMGGQE